MEKIKIANGIFYVDIPDADLRILCGCPADSVKHLKKRGVIVTKEKNGVSYETGPNAILLSDVTIQNGSFANLAEFPVLHMFYRQGLILPNHPNNTGKKPILIGSKEQIIGQSRYIYRGNYGLISKEEIIAAGITKKDAEEMMRMKLRFAFGAIRKTEELLEFHTVESRWEEIRNGVAIRRLGMNRYEIKFKKETLEINLNLEKNELYEQTYALGYYQIKPEYFSVVHIGEGDGWDPDRPCMGSILTFQGRIYLIDAGPGISQSLTALGISINEIEGIFHTHCHDDHFAGLTSLIRSDHMINYYSTPLVRSSVVKKLCSLMSISEEKFPQYFNVHDLVFDEWNRLGGLEVMPTFSAHPVETNTLYFRTEWAGGYKTYAHLADISSVAVLKGLMGKGDGIGRTLHNKIKAAMFLPVDLKKIDAGGGPIHGDARDFEKDESKKIIISHKNKDYSLKEKEFGSTAAFGQTDVLIPSRQDYSMKTAHTILRSYFPDADISLIRMLLDCPVMEYNPGSIILRKGTSCPKVYLLLTGVAEAINADLKISNLLSSGSLIGEVSFLEEKETAFTFRALSPLRALEIPCDLFGSFVREVKVFEDIKRLYLNRRFLIQTDLFGEMLSFPVQNEIARRMLRESVPAGTILEKSITDDLHIVESGSVRLGTEEIDVATLGPKDFFGEEGILFGTTPVYTIKALEDTTYFVIPGEMLKIIPIVQIKLLETFKKRLSSFTAKFTVVWKKSFSLGLGEIDSQHEKLFSLIADVSSPLKDDKRDADCEKKFKALFTFTQKHFAFEENLLKEYDYPNYARQKDEHDSILHELSVYHERLCSSRDEAEVDFLEYLKGWIVTHILNEDRKYGPFFKELGLILPVKKEQ